MAVHKHPIAHRWVKQTLVPFLLYAFAPTLPYPADISTQIERSIEFCLKKPDHPSDGDDLIFKRIFMAIMHRHKNLAPELEMVVDNLEPLAKYLIRRAQLKGPYELLERSDVGSDAWVEYERRRLGNVVIELERSKDELNPPVRPPTPLNKSPSDDDHIDPRLVHAQPGHFSAKYIPAQLTAEQDSYYRRQNRKMEQASERKQQEQACNPAVSAHITKLYHDLSGRGYTDTAAAYELTNLQSPQSQWQQQPYPASEYINHHAQQHESPSQRRNQAPQLASEKYLSKFQSGPMNTPRNDAFMQRFSPPPQPAAHPASQRQPFHTSSAARQYPATTVPLASPETALASDTPHPPPHPVHPPTRPSSTISSSDFAHLRGTDWSNAAQQRAREIAAKISAWERDMMAHDIMQRQQAIAQQSPGCVPSGSMHTMQSSLTMPGRPNSAVRHPTAPVWSDEMASNAVRSPSGCAVGGSLGELVERGGVSMQEQVRGGHDHGGQRTHGAGSTGLVARWQRHGQYGGHGSEHAFGR